MEVESTQAASVAAGAAIIALPLPPTATSAAPAQQADQPAGVAEMSPNKRYIRFDDVISCSGDSIQDSFKAFDTKNGIEVAWHTINLNSLAESEQIGVTQCVNILKKIQDKHIIEYLSCWFRAEARTLNVITTHLDTLKDFIGKVFTLRWRIVKKWCRQILRGLDHLHSHEPQIIHRSLTCSHIYIDSGLSATNIGDLWLAAVISDDQGTAVGLSDGMIKELAKKSSPAFIAPELYDASCRVSSKVDIYSFGMCVIAMITRNEPYQECTDNLTKLRSKVLAGKLPRAINSISSPLAREFISECLKPASERPTAAQLLQHPFLVTTSEDDEQVLLERLEAPEMPESTTTSQIVDVDHLKSQAFEPYLGLFSKDQSSLSGASCNPASATADEEAAEKKSPTPSVDVSGRWDTILGKELADLDHGENVHVDRGLHDGRRAADDMPAEDLVLELKRGVGAKAVAEEKTVSVSRQNVTELQLKIIIPASKTKELEADKEVEFTFDVLKDNFWTVASEMIDELQLTLSAEELAAQIATVVVKPHKEVQQAAAAVAPTVTAKYMAPEYLATEERGVALEPDVSTIAAAEEEAPATPATDSVEPPTTPAVEPPTMPAVEPPTTPAVEPPTTPAVEPLTTPVEPPPLLSDPATAISPAADIIAPPEATVLRREVEIEMDMNLNSMDDVERELEKLDKESRVARRAFEQRIQKHKSIQEQCHDDFLRLEEEYASKRAELDRKEESALRRREGEVQKLQTELELRLRSYREIKVGESRAAKAKAREERLRGADAASTPGQKL